MVSSKKTHSQKMKMKKSDISFSPEGRKIFINVNLMESTGPIRLFVNRNQTVESVIVTSVETFARHGRLQVLGCKPHQFDLYCLTNSGWQVLEPSEVIGFEGRWNFKLYKKPSIATTKYFDTITNKSGLKSDHREVLDPSKTIGLEGRWNFRICKKPSATTNCDTTSRCRSKSDLLNLFKSWF